MQRLVANRGVLSRMSVLLLLVLGLTVTGAMDATRTTNSPSNHSGMAPRLASLEDATGNRSNFGNNTDEEGSRKTTWTLRPDCKTRAFKPMARGVCVRSFRTGPGEEWEPHLAVHPNSPNTALLAGTYLDTSRPFPFTYAAYDAFVWGAITRDGGRTWTMTRLSDPALQETDPPTGGRYAFDPIAAFGPDGTAYVLFVGENQGPDGRVHYRMTLAKSVDHGRTWQYHTFHESAGGIDGAHDYPDLAIAPDTGHLYVAVAVIFKSQLATTWVWRSTDRGETWERTAELYPPTLPVAFSEDSYKGPRIAVGNDGLIVVGTLHQAPGTSPVSGVAAWISRDGGKSFEDPVKFPAERGPVGGGMQTVLWTNPQGNARIDLLFTAPDSIKLIRSNDEGRTWEDPTVISKFPSGTDGLLAEVIVGGDGTLYVLERLGGQSTDRFGAFLIRFRHPNKTVARMTLVDTKREGGGPERGGHYDGLALGPDGTFWVAWGDPRGPGPDRIVLSRLRRP